jgi:Rrf2 family protein
VVSRTEEYALRAAVCLARRYGGGTVRAREMARDTGIPANYLSKILHQLAKSGVVASERGRAGGFTLAAPPSTVALASVVAPFAPQVQRTRCLLGLPQCSDSNPCGAHERWKTIKDATLDFLNNTTLADVIESGDTDASRC